MKMIKRLSIAALLALTPMAQALNSEDVTVTQYWVGPGGYDRVFVSGDMTGLRGTCTAAASFAIKTDDPNYESMQGLVLMAMTTGMKINAYSPGTECMSTGIYQAVNRIALKK
jgi:hypothetical protein